MDAAQIRAILGDAVKDDGKLEDYPYAWENERLDWSVGDEKVFIGGYGFTAAELEAIAAHMRAHEAK